MSIATYVLIYLAVSAVLTLGIVAPLCGFNNRKPCECNERGCECNGGFHQVDFE